jgi:hypothetical protein
LEETPTITTNESKNGFEFNQTLRVAPPKMTTAINIGRVPHENGLPRPELPRPKHEWWDGEKKLTIPKNGERRVYFRTDDGREWRFHRTDDTLALLRQNGKERREEARPRAELCADPKWAGKLLERRVRMTAQKTRRTWRWATLELRPTLVAYYGARTTVETKMTAGMGVAVNHTTDITYALHPTPDTPTAFPLNGDQQFQTIYGNAMGGHHHHYHLHPTLVATYAEEQRRQGKAKPDLTHRLARGTKWVIVAYTTTTTTYADGRPSKTTTKELDERNAELPYTSPLLMLTGFSTKAHAGATPQIETTNTLDYDYKFKALYANLEATRRLKAEVKREICEAVLHPDRVDRMAVKFDLHAAEYVELI